MSLNSLIILWLYLCFYRRQCVSYGCLSDHFVFVFFWEVVRSASFIVRMLDLVDVIEILWSLKILWWNITGLLVMMLFVYSVHKAVRRVVSEHATLYCTVLLHVWPCMATTGLRRFQSSKVNTVLSFFGFFGFLLLLNQTFSSRCGSCQLDLQGGGVWGPSAGSSIPSKRRHNPLSHYM